MCVYFQPICEYLNLCPGSVAAAASSTAPTTTTSASEKKDFLFDVKFDGISLAMDDCEKKILSTVVKGELKSILMSVIGLKTVLWIHPFSKCFKMSLHSYIALHACTCIVTEAI